MATIELDTPLPNASVSPTFTTTGTYSDTSSLKASVEDAGGTSLQSVNCLLGKDDFRATFSDLPPTPAGQWYTLIVAAPDGTKASELIRVVAT
jgi:hypothetical protein